MYQLINSNFLIRTDPFVSIRNLLSVPKYHNKSYGDKAFSIAASRRLNSLSSELRQLHSPQ